MSMRPPGDPLPAEVLAALQRGGTVEAIKLLREATGLGLKEAKELIDRHRIDLQRGAGSVPVAGGAAVAGLPPEVCAALQQGNKLEAIRLLREQTGLGLKEAKDAVEAFPGAATAARSPLDEGASRSTLWLIAGLLALAVLVYLIFRRTS